MPKGLNEKLSLKFGCEYVSLNIIYFKWVVEPDKWCLRNHQSEISSDRSLFHILMNGCAKRVIINLLKLAFSKKKKKKVWDAFEKTWSRIRSSEQAGKRRTDRSQLKSSNFFPPLLDALPSPNDEVWISFYVFHCKDWRIDEFPWWVTQIVSPAARSFRLSAVRGLGVANLVWVSTCLVRFVIVKVCNLPEASWKET